MDHVLVDSTVVIDILRDRPAARECVRRMLAQGRPVYVSAITVEEVARGIRDHEVESARLLFESLDVVPIGADVAWLAGIWRGELARAGVTVPQGDCLIAASAHAAGASLATGNPKHFPMSELVVEHWPVGV